jgi:DNA ligase (NAD+)
MIAYKFPVEIAEIKLLNVFSYHWRTGAVGHKAKLKPIQIAGTTVSATTLHNSEYVKEINVNVADIVKIN